MIRQARNRDDATFDLTPMIDVVLLLIIFFMLTAQFAKSDQSGVNLPEQRGQAGDDQKGATLIVDIDKFGNLSMWGTPTNFEAVINDATLANKAAGRAPMSVMLRADKDCAAATLQNLCAGLSQVGIKAVALGTQSDGSDAGPGGPAPDANAGGAK